MDEFKPAPDNQPTENIELMLRTAKAKYYEWEKANQDDQERVDRSERMMEHWDNEERQLEWQLRQRRNSV